MDVGICGLGAVTGYGWGTELFWDGLANTRLAASLTPGYGPERDQRAWVATVPDGGDPADGPSRFARAMRAAAREAIADAERRGWQPGRRVGLLHATVLGEVDLWQPYYALQRGNIPLRDFLAMAPSTPMSMFMQEYGFHGPAMTVSAMDASGNAGLITAKTWLDTGAVDDVVFVSTDLSANPANVLHFDLLGLAVTDTEPLDACRPFQEGSRGFIMGEASVGMVLSKRSPNAYALVRGGAMSHDAHHVNSIDPTLTELRGCFREAMDITGTRSADVRYVNAHGPGIKQIDHAEAAIVDELFPRADVYSIKPLVGHCHGAAAAVEVAVTALAHNRGIIPAPPTVAPGHPRLLNGPTPVADGITVKSALGMGGHNSAVVLSPPE